MFLEPLAPRTATTCPLFAIFHFYDPQWFVPTPIAAVISGLILHLASGLSVTSPASEIIRAPDKNPAVPRSILDSSGDQAVLVLYETQKILEIRQTSGTSVNLKKLNKLQISRNYTNYALQSHLCQENAFAHRFPATTANEERSGVTVASRARRVFDIMWQTSVNIQKDGSLRALKMACFKSTIAAIQIQCRAIPI